LDDELQFNQMLRASAVLVVDDEPGMRNFLKKALENRCALLEVASSVEEAEALRLRYHFDLLLVDIRLPGLSGLDWLSMLRARGIRTPVIYMTAYADLEMAIGAIRSGADDFIMKPFRIEQMYLSIRRTLTRGQISQDNSLLRLQLSQIRQDEGIVGESKVMQDMVALIQKLAPTHAPVMIYGDTGTGKSLVARSVHNLSRRTGAFLSVDCCSCDESTIEDELFSDEGLLVHADKGSVFLDEIGELPESLHARLLHVLEYGKLPNQADLRGRPIDVRIIATSTRDLVGEMRHGSAQTDLFYRLNFHPVKLPPLKKRGKDIELLANCFMDRLSVELKCRPVKLLHADWQQLSNYHWPGNVRELRNVIERTLLLGSLPDDSFESLTDESWSGPGYPLSWDLESVERSHIEAVLASVNNNKSAAARILGVSRKTLERKQALWYGTADET
jgi:DNA-binding NtrC family response regulator